MKRLTLLLLACLTLLTACDRGNQGRYEDAQLYLGAGDPLTAARLFDELGEYADAADYAAYCRALYALQTGDHALARRAFDALGDFKSSRRYVAYVDARLAPPEEALRLFEALGTFADSAEQAAALAVTLPEDAMRTARALMDRGEWALAQAALAPYAQHAGAAELLRACEDALVRAAYDQACALEAAASYAEAIAAFDALGDALDSPAHVAACKAALYRAAERDYPAASLQSARALMDAYALLDGYLLSSERLQALTERFGPSLALLDQADAHPYVAYGAYPGGADGAPEPILWRVLHAEGQTLTLVCASVLDAAPLATPSDLDALLPAALDLTRMPLDMRCVPAAACAIAHGVTTDAQGRAAWLLADLTDLGAQLCIGPDGQITTSGRVAAGVRPMVTVSLAALAPTCGDGTEAFPFS